MPHFNVIINYVVFLRHQTNQSMAKTELFDKSLQQSAIYFKALSHPARLAILSYLSETGTCINGDITEELPLSRTTVSQHLHELITCKLIQGTVDGAKVNYCIDPEGVEKVITTLKEMIAALEKSKTCNC
jgi:DNA-binding transcriptional ArsR family regulator